MSQLENKAQFWKATCSIDYLLIQTIYDHLGPQRTVENWDSQNFFEASLYELSCQSTLFCFTHLSGKFVLCLRCYYILSRHINLNIERFNTYDGWFHLNSSLITFWTSKFASSSRSNWGLPGSFLSFLGT